VYNQEATHMVGRNACSELEHDEVHMHFSLPRLLDLLHLRLAIHLIETGRVNRVHLSSSTLINNCSSVILNHLPHAHHCFHHLCRLFFHGLHISLHLFLYFFDFTHYSGLGTRLVRVL